MRFTLGLISYMKIVLCENFAKSRQVCSIETVYVLFEIIRGAIRYTENHHNN